MTVLNSLGIVASDQKRALGYAGHCRRTMSHGYYYF